MNNTYLSTRLKELRNRKGLSQETLAEESGLSLRTIQRIENNESKPTGETLKRLSNALDINPDELIDWSIKEDLKYLVFMNLSSLTFIFFPLLGILVPFMLWSSRKGKIKNINEVGRALINFEITWTITLFIIPFVLFLFSKIGILENFNLALLITVLAMMYLVNILLIVVSSIRISNGKNALYFSVIKFLK